MQIWTVVNQKGGVGKTTTVVSLAGLLVERGQRVLMVDTDPHASLGYYSGLDPEELPGSLFDLFYHYDTLTQDLIESVIVPTNVPRLDLLPAATALATLDRSLGTKPGMGFILSTILRSLQHRYDVVLIDCSPVLGVLMVNALAACRQLIIPVQTEFLALKGLERMLQTLTRLGQSGRAIPPYLIVPTMFDRRTRASLHGLSELVRRYPLHLWRSMIPIDPYLRDASAANLPAPQYAPDCQGVRAYSELLNELLAKGVSNVPYRAASGE